MISDTRHQLARLVQRLRRLVRGEVQLGGHQARLLPAADADVTAALALADELRVPVVLGGGALLDRMAQAQHMDGSGAGSAGAGSSGPDAADSPAALHIDASAHLTRAAHFDERRGMIELQAGVRLADINRLLVPRGWWLPIETSPDCGATVAGLVARDAVAAAPAWGTMADRLVGIDAVLADGTQQLFGPFGERSSVALTSGRAGQLVSSLFGVAAGVQGEIRQRWPTGMRVPDGYLLDAFHPRPGRPYTADGSVNLAHLLAGSAGTLAWSAGLHLQLLRRPAVSRWALFVFASAQQALARAAQAGLLERDGPGPSAVLLLDGDDLARLRASGHAADRALVSMTEGDAGADFSPANGPVDGPGTGRTGLAGSAAGNAVPGRAPAGLLVRFSGDDDAGVQAAHRRLAAALMPARRAETGGLLLGTDEAASDHGTVPAVPEQMGRQPGVQPSSLAVWRRLLGELVEPAGAPSYAHPAIGPAWPGLSAVAHAGMWRATWRLWPQAPQACAAFVSALESRLGSLGVQPCWRGQLLAGELQMRARLSARQIAQVSAAFQAAQPVRWAPALQAAFGQVRVAFDPRGILCGDPRGGDGWPTHGP